MVNNYAKSPWGGHGTNSTGMYGRYTAEYARQAYQKLISEVRAQEMDEGHATETYEKLAQLADDLGETSAAETFRMISRQEAKHRTDLQFIIGALEMQMKEVH